MPFAQINEVKAKFLKIMFHVLKACQEPVANYYMAVIKRSLP